MNKSLIVTMIIALMQIFIVAIPLSGKLSDNRKKWFKRLTMKGWGLISCCLIVALMTIYLFNISEMKDEQSEKTLRSQLQKRDSIHQQIVADAAIKYIDRLDKSSLETAKALAQYGLKYDDTRKEIFKAVSTDTLKPALDPEVFVDSEKGIELDTVNGNFYNFKVKLTNKIAPAKNIKLDMFFISLKGNYIKILNVNNPFKIYPKGSAMNFESITTTNAVVESEKADTFIFYLVGTFENRKKESFVVSRLYAYNMTTKSFGTPTELIYHDLVGLLKRNKLFREEIE